MDLFDHFDEIGKENIRTSSNDFINAIGIDATKDVIKTVLLGGNVRDITEFITQRRLLNTYASTLKLFVKNLEENTKSISDYSNSVVENIMEATGDARILNLWLIGLTKKGLDNVVRDSENILFYKDTFTKSTEQAVKNLIETFGIIDGKLNLNGDEITLDWNFLALLFISIGSQTLSIRGSAKSMNGKLFEKLVLGVLLTIMGFEYKQEPPSFIGENEKCFWLSSTDANEREIDATLAFKQQIISIDIGFIGKGNPEITLDKVTRFGSYKEIGGIQRDSTTIIIVDTIGANSDLVNKAKAVNGHVLQMKNKEWVKNFATLLNSIFDENIFPVMPPKILDSYLTRELPNIPIEKFI